MKKLHTLVAIATLAASAASTAQEVTAYDALPAAAPSKSRAEVLAELSLWQRAGLHLFNRDGADLNSVEYERRMAEYQRLRSGPEYVAELQRLQGERTRSAGLAQDIRSN